MRNMSFSLTTEQYKRRGQTVTRRLGWGSLKPGDMVCGVGNCQCLKKGEKVKRLHVIQVVSNTPEQLRYMDKADCIREGFPDMEPPEFIAMFCKHNKCRPTTVINRIEFRYLS